MPLNGEGIVVISIIPRMGNGIVPAVAVVKRPRPRGFGDHDLLVIGIGDVLENGGKVLGSPVPVGIPRGRENVVIDAVVV